MKKKLFSERGAVLVVAACLPVVCWAQVNNGSDGHDGALHVTNNLTINMADHPNGIYQYSSVNIEAGNTVWFTPNASNAPVVWLVQSNCVINGTVNVCGQTPNGSTGGAGGPGGWDGGSGSSVPSGGQGPGGGGAGCAASYGNLGSSTTDYWSVNYPPGSTYGNSFLLPLMGGSGGGGILAHSGGWTYGGGGGGGAILVAAPSQITVGGSILAKGGNGTAWGNGMGAGPGSGGSVRLVSQTLAGAGSVDASGGFYPAYSIFPGSTGGSGRVRFDSYRNNFAGSINGVFSQGFQPVILPTGGQGAQLTVSSIGGVAVAASPTGLLSIPDAVISAQQANPIPVVVNCSNIPLNTVITVSVRPASGATVTAVGHNSTGTQASSTATVLISIPRGGGIIWATATTSN